MTEPATPAPPLGGREILTRLLAVTTAPGPEAGPDAEVAELLAAFEAIVAQRAAIIALIVPPVTLSEQDRPLYAELERRQNIWQDVLGAALRRVGGQRCAASQLRAYAGRR